MSPQIAFSFLGGIAIFERQTFFRSSDVENIQARNFPGLPPIEFHAQNITSGKGFWRSVDRELRDKVLKEIAQVIDDSDVHLFAVAVEKDDQLYGEDAVRYATEQVCNRFDIFLKRRWSDAEDPQRGLLIFDESRYQQRSKVWVRGFRELGTRYLSPIRKERFDPYPSNS